MLDPEVVVAPGLELGVVLGVVTVTGGLEGAMKMPHVILVQVVPGKNKVSWVLAPNQEPQLN